MATKAIGISVGKSLGDGRYSSSVKGGSAPDLATILTDITTALSNAGGSYDSTTDITAIQVDAVSLTTAVTADLTVSWDSTKITTINQLKAALDRVLFGAKSGIGGLTA